MRIAFAIERYWPLITAASRILDTLAGYLRQQGHEVLVLTAQVDHLWPEFITVRNVPVRRFGLDSWSLFGRKSLGQRMAHWLDREADQWDVLVVCEWVEGGHFLFQVAEHRGRPALLSFFESGKWASLGQLLENQSGDSREGFAGNGGGHRNAAWLSRRHWIVPDELATADIRRLRPQAQVAAWGLGIPETSLMSMKDRQQIRTAICRSRADFDRYCGPPLIVYHGHLHPGRDSQWLWQLLAGLCENRPGISAWVTGDGGAVHGLWRQANEAGLEDRIIFPGVFSDLHDLYSMADLVVLPQQERVDNYNWLMAVAAGTPCLVARSPGTDRVTKLIHSTEAQHWLWTHVLPTDLDAWWEQAWQVLDRGDQAQALVREQRLAILRHYHQDDTLQQYERLLIRLQEESC